jgi:hypothetical protein
VTPRGFSTAETCETARLEQYSREYGRRTVSLSLYLDAIGHGADASTIETLHRRATDDSGHDDQLDKARCIHSGDARLAQVGQVGTGAMYLLIPPMAPDSGEDIRQIGKEPVHLRVRFDAPLSRWVQLGAYDAATACEAERHARLAGVDSQVRQRPKETFSESAAWMAAARCVDVADPQLSVAR